MGRCVMILGVPRSGTSAVAGVLHHLGIDMGNGHLQNGNRWNPRGYFEDLRWQKLNKQITGPRYGHRQPATVSERQDAQYKALADLCNVNWLWGMKDPRLCFTAQFIWPHLKDVRIVAVMRNPLSAAMSLMKHSHENYGGEDRMTIDQAIELRDIWAGAMEDRLTEFQGPVLRVFYEELVNRPTGLVKDLATFAFDGLRAAWPDIEAGVQFVEPRLNHA